MLKRGIIFLSVIQVCILLLNLLFVNFLGGEELLEKETTNHLSLLSPAQKIKVNEAPSRDNLQPATSKGRLRLEVDVADDAGIDTISELIRLEHIKASEIEPFIKARLSRYGIVQTNDALNMLIITDKEPKVRDLTRLVKGLDVAGLKDFLRLETEVIPLNYSLPSSLTHIIKERLSYDGIIQADDNLGVVIITDVRSKIDYAKNIIALLDIPSQQVLIEAQIVETREEFIKELGIDWWNFLYKGEIDIDVSKYDQTQHLGIRAGTWIKLHEIINFLIKEGRAKLLANPKIITLNNSMGKIDVREDLVYEIPYRYYQYYQKEEIGLSLEITPYISASNYIKMNILAKTRNINGWDSKGLPIISEQCIHNSVLVKGGETFIIGGLKKKNVIKVTKKFPILGYILPYIFSKKKDSIEEKEVFIFITPRIINIATPKESTNLEK